MRVANLADAQEWIESVSHQKRPEHEIDAETRSDTLGVSLRMTGTNPT
ncbi:MAG: hypothetical protein ACR2G5_06685 [Pyrinomonadaceae bacterium]